MMTETPAPENARAQKRRRAYNFDYLSMASCEWKKHEYCIADIFL
jgi:hypothetical protein